MEFRTKQDNAPNLFHEIFGKTSHGNWDKYNLGIIDNDTCTAGNYVDSQSKTSIRIPELALNLEEADMRTIPHIVWQFTTIQRFFRNNCGI